MRPLLVLLILIPTLSWGLTFKNGKQVDEKNLNEVKLNNIDVKNSNIANISKPGLIFISKNDFIENLIQNSNKILCHKRRLALPNFKIKRQDEYTNSAHDILYGMGEDAVVRWCYEQITNFKSQSSKINDETINQGLLDDLNLVTQKILTPPVDTSLNLKEYFIELEKTEYLLKLPRPNDDIQFAYEIGRFLPSLLFTYSLMKDDFTKEEQDKINKMFKKIVNNYSYVWNITHLGKANKGLYFNNYSLLTAIVINDEKLFNQSIKKFKSIMKYNSSETGFMKKDGKRGECGLVYNLHGLAPIMSTLWNLRIQGIDLTQEKLSNNHSMDEIVFAILDVANNPEKLKEFQKKYGLSSNGSQKSCYQWMSKTIFDIHYNKELDVIMPFSASGWIYVYKALSSNPEENLELFYKVKYLKYNIDIKSGDQNAIGVLPIAIYQ